MSTTVVSTLFATCPKGLEYLLRDELVTLGADDVHEARAGVHFRGSVETAMRVCLWSRLASRVLWPLLEFEAPDEQALYDAVRGIDWAGHLAADGSLLVDVTLAGSHKDNSHFLAQRVKDAVVDRFREHGGAIPRVARQQPDIRLNLHIHRGHARLALDLAGNPLHQRGWRVRQGRAPLKENLAAAMLLRADWPAIYAQGGVLVDPMCGSGTLLVEGAWMVADVAPGLHRPYFGFAGWKGHDSATWTALLDEARQRADAGLRELRPAFFGSDIDPHMVQVATHNVQQAGVAGFVQLARRDVAHLEPPDGQGSGLVITNPPYGERLGEREDMPRLYRGLGDTLRDHFIGWKIAILAGDQAFGHAMRLHSHKQYKLFNGALETPLLLFDLAPERQVVTRKPLSEGAQMLANRLRKNERALRKWRAQAGIHCWRGYDRDLPEYAVAVDVYEATDGMAWVHVQEYRAPRDVLEDTARRHLHEAVHAVAEVFGVPRDRIAVKQRRRGKGGARYGVMDERGELIGVEEGGLRFLVNLFDYLDTGLFPDHRLVRQRLRQLAAGRRFLNLYAYTGTASVYAASGGARATTSVDLSATYLDWASRNLALNGFTGRTHQLVQSDVRAFLARDRARYGVIYVDPPTFSNSKRADDFDVQRDHVGLLEACGEHLEADGVIVFSNNSRRFTLDIEVLSQSFEITDWTAASIPRDYARHRDIHGCWLLRRSV